VLWDVSGTGTFVHAHHRKWLLNVNKTSPIHSVKLATVWVSAKLALLLLQQKLIPIYCVVRQISFCGGLSVRLCGVIGLGGL
jgi:hypothetical protein